MAAQISLTFDTNEDRLHLKVVTGQQLGHWWLTRRIALRLLKAWVGKLEEVAPPQLDMPWLHQAPRRNLPQEHELSLEFDALRHEPKATQGAELARLVTTVQLKVTPLETRLTLIGVESQASIPLTRKESHALVEALALQARNAQWLEGWALPEWMGQRPDKQVGE